MAVFLSDLPWSRGEACRWDFLQTGKQTLIANKQMTWIDWHWHSCGTVCILYFVFGFCILSLLLSILYLVFVLCVVFLVSILYLVFVVWVLYFFFLNCCAGETRISVCSGRCLRRRRGLGLQRRDRQWVAQSWPYRSLKDELDGQYGNYDDNLADVVMECIAGIGTGNPLGIYQCVMVRQLLTHFLHISVSFLREFFDWTFVFIIN